MLINDVVSFEQPGPDDDDDYNSCVKVLCVKFLLLLCFLGSLYWNLLIHVCA